MAPVESQVVVLGVVGSKVEGPRWNFQSMLHTDLQDNVVGSALSLKCYTTQTLNWESGPFSELLLFQLVEV